MLRGEIWTAVWPADPLKKERPVLVVSNNIRNQDTRLHDIVVAKITSLERANGTKKLVNSSEDFVFKLRNDSIIRCASLYSIEKTILKRHLTQLTAQQMKEIDVRLKVVLDLN